MNFFPNDINPVSIPFPNNYDINNQNLFYKINELENRIRKLEQRISIIENENNKEEYLPDNSLYMI